MIIVQYIIHFFLRLKDLSMVTQNLEYILLRQQWCTFDKDSSNVQFYLALRWGVKQEYKIVGANMSSTIKSIQNNDNLIPCPNEYFYFNKCVLFSINVMNRNFVRQSTIGIGNWISIWIAIWDALPFWRQKTDNLYVFYKTQIQHLWIYSCMSYNL